MAYTPVEIRHVKFGRGLVGGYKRDVVDKTLGEITLSFEDVWRERADLADRVEALETELSRLREREELLKETLISAERNAAEVKETAQKQADLTLAEAHSEARSITRGAQSERERLIAEARSVRALLRSALDIVEEAHAPADEEQKADEASAAPEPWPRHDDTREFGGVPSGHIRSA
jgi:cell division initiation protein